MFALMNMLVDGWMDGLACERQCPKAERYKLLLTLVLKRRRQHVLRSASNLF